MSLRRAVAVPFRQRGVERMTESEFVVALSLDRDWFSPDQAKRVVTVGAGEGLLERTDDDVIVEFDPASVDIPEDFEPTEEILRQRTTFERILEAVVDSGIDKQTAVAEINQLQSELAVTIEAAAVLYGRRNGLELPELAQQARQELDHG
ncbi:DUF2240 family protein [Halovenus sp. WSH3]|uniref:DUF2240 family protein n=1 Tax=Halovenus carboxidivorans TaxID=2692199 RepID=A0A6B0SZQ0_9EURY|nr:DUF2240 family protein [Halovenus carboxidivorans]MXR51338.1 DUF2240 family protein [Halovenus carboxidivorans]